jgi:hypothetical protein
MSTIFFGIAMTIIGALLVMFFWPPSLYEIVMTRMDAGVTGFALFDNIPDDAVRQMLDEIHACDDEDEGIRMAVWAAGKEALAHRGLTHA